jgi:cell wall-associated NlpC family hydrolase
VRSARIRRSIVAIVAATAFLSIVVATTPAAAIATPNSPSANARQRAHQLRVQLEALQVQAETATEDYNAAQAELGQVVTQHLLAQGQLENAQSGAVNAGAMEASTVRAIYRVGGAAALYATVFQGTDPGDVFARIHAVQNIVDGKHAASGRASAIVGDAAAIEKRLGKLAHEQTQLQRVVDTAMRRVENNLTKQQSLVASADAEVLRLQQAEAEAAAAAAARNASTSLAQARANAVPGGAGDVAPPNTDLVALAITAAQAQIGKPYRWGATGPDTFDCSGLTGWAYAQAGVSLPRTSRQQWFSGLHPGLAYLAPGDLLFWASNPADASSIHHVALYIGNDQMIAAPHTGATVAVQPVFLDGYIGAVRPTHL